MFMLAAKDCMVSLLLVLQYRVDIMAVATLVTMVPLPATKVVALVEALQISE